MKYDNVEALQHDAMRVGSVGASPIRHSLLLYWLFLSLATERTNKKGQEKRQAEPPDYVNSSMADTPEESDHDRVGLYSSM